MGGLSLTILVCGVHVSHVLGLHSAARVHSLVSNCVLAGEVRVLVKVVKVVGVPMEISIDVDRVLQVVGYLVLGDSVESWLFDVVERDLVFSELIFVN